MKYLYDDEYDRGKGQLLSEEIYNLANITPAEAANVIINGENDNINTNAVVL